MCIRDRIIPTPNDVIGYFVLSGKMDSLDEFRKGGCSKKIIRSSPDFEIGILLERNRLSKAFSKSLRKLLFKTELS